MNPVYLSPQFRMSEVQLQSFSVFDLHRSAWTIALISVRSTVIAMQYGCDEYRSAWITEDYGVENGTANLTTTEHPRSVRGSILDGGIANQDCNASDQSASSIPIPRRQVSHRRSSASRGQLSLNRESSVSKHNQIVTHHTISQAKFASPTKSMSTVALHR